MRSRILLVVLAVASLSSVADAHFVLVSPAASLVQNRLGDPQKIAPCGGVSANPARNTPANPGTPTNAVTQLTGGSLLHLLVQEALQLALDIGELILKLEEVRIGLELGIGLSDCEQTSEKPGHLRVSLCRGLDTAGLYGRGAGFRNLLEDLTLVCRVPLNGLHEVGNEVGAAAKLDGDPAKAFLHQSAQPDETIVDADGEHQHQDDDRDNDPAHDSHAHSPQVRRVRT